MKRVGTFHSFLFLCFLPVFVMGQQNSGPVQERVNPAGKVLLGESFFSTIQVSNTAPVEASIRINFSSNVLVQELWGAGFTSNFSYAEGGYHNTLPPNSDNNTIYSWLWWAAVGDATLNLVQETGGILQTQVVKIAEVQPLDPKTTLHFAGIEIPAAVYNRATDRLLFLRGRDVEMYAPKTGTRQVVSGRNDLVLEGPTLLRTGSDATVYSGAFGLGDNKTHLGFARYRAEPLQREASLLPFPGKVLDFDVSPADSSILAVQGITGLSLLRGTNLYFLPRDFGGHLGFSRLGDVLYWTTPSCELQVFAVPAEGPLVLLNTFTNVSCADFKSINQQLYFEDGTIFDASTGRKETNVFSLNPTRVAVESEQTLNVLGKINGSWVIYRVNTKSLVPFQTVPVDSINGDPLELISMGAQGAAIRSAQEVVVVPFPDASGVSLQISEQAGALALHFSKQRGATYTLLSSSDLRTWQTEETIPDGDGDFKKPLSSSQHARFYRLLIEPN